ncbi:MAG: 1-deoxy-D-xylulose-5-phosphate synthase [Paracoccaceae bacterium]|jgi:1-deoxy-D-xylulose-5-phosphate synthase|nr:1-deoxy-D-xylulose-5-phosphate synthase [Paracoccaceae bacterium]|tara:strand:+ start:900 stop:2846 length:1947 start_codon:yes stop_codon:yes gene_type:complete
MSDNLENSLLHKVKTPKDLRLLNDNQLDQVSRELRNEVIEVVSQTGGHLGSSLGVVELTVALHAVFNTPFDKLIWDVGHQCYPHKIITERRNDMNSLRQKDGLSGFTKRSESEYDPFGAAHSSTSISAALGFAMARELGQPVGDTIAVIGDGSITAGMAYEALNNAGSENKRMFVILNDNEMSIAPPVGAMSSYLSTINSHQAFEKLKLFGEEIESHLPSTLREGARRARQLVTGRNQSTFFEDLGFNYLGPIDGHDMGQLLHVLRAAKFRSTGPTLIHVCTKKGHGYAPAENSADKYHGVSKFNIQTGQQSKAPANAPSYTSIFGNSLLEEAKSDTRVVGITAAMPSGTGINILANEFPERVFDVGIAEQHAVTFAAGLAAGGMKPFCAIYSTFLQRAYDQIVHDVALQNLPVRFAIDRAGLVGADGATHAGVFDISYMSNIPNMTVMAASDEAELVHMVRTAAEFDEGPIAFRYPRGNGTGIQLPQRGEILEIGKGRIVQEGEDLVILSFGAHMNLVKDAEVALAKMGVSVTIADARFVKPLDVELIDHLMENHPCMLTVEQGAMGGFGSIVLNHVNKNRSRNENLRFDSIFVADRFIDQADVNSMYDEAGMGINDIIDKSIQLMEQSNQMSKNFNFGDFKRTNSF